MYVGNRKTSNKKFVCRTKLKISPPYICKLCDKELKSIPGIASHIKNSHDGYAYGDYLKKFYDFDVDKVNNDWEIGRTDRKIKKIEKFKLNNPSKGKTIKERMSEEQYKNFRISMKGVFTKEWFIEKHGEEDGMIQYNTRLKNLSLTTFWRKYNKQNKQNWSKISQELFWNIHNSIKSNFVNIYFGELNHEYSCGNQNCNFDFVVVDNKKIIEFNGDRFHANPKIFNKNEIPLKFIGKTSSEIWKEDKIKYDKAKEKEYTIKIIWESDYIKDKEKITSDCINFILNEKTS